MKSKKTSKVEVKWKESLLKPGNKFRLKATGEILIYLRPSDKQFQKVPLHVYKKEATNEEIECKDSEVEKID